MSNILLAAGSKKSSDAFQELIAEVLDEASVIRVSQVGDARQCLKQSDVDLVIVNTPMADEQGIEFAVYAADSEMLVVILVTNSDTCGQVRADMEKHGIIVMERPVEKKIFSCTLRSSVILSKKIRILREKNAALQDRIEESKLIARAKGMLMSHLNMTEAQAHRFIEKQAMDLRLPRKTVSQNILKTYYNK